MAVPPNPGTPYGFSGSGYIASAAANAHLYGAVKRETREEFMFGSEPIVAYRIWKIGRPSFDTLPDFLGLLADAHDAGADNPYRWALARTQRTLLMPIANQYHGSAWLPGVTEARCTAHGHTAPDLQCECGFWALRDEQQLVAAFQSYQPDAWGTVKLWGRFCEFEKGFRAQHAYPERITLLRKDEAVAAELAQTYGCEVVCGDVPASVLEARKSVANAVNDEIQKTIQWYNTTLNSLSSQYISTPPKPKKWWGSV